MRGTGQIERERPTLMRLSTLLCAAAILGCATASAQSAPPHRCAPNGACSGPVYDAFVREQAQTAAIAYSRALNHAIALRNDDGATDFAYDLTQILVPSITGDNRVRSDDAQGRPKKGSRSRAPQRR